METFPMAVAVAGKLAIAVMNVPGPAGGMVILIDLSDPDELRQIARTETAEFIASVAVLDDAHAIFGGSSEVYTLDFSDASAPTIVGPISAGGVGLRVSDGQAYGLGWWRPDQANLSVLDVTDPADVVELQRVPLGLRISAWSFAVADRTVYLLAAASVQPDAPGAMFVLDMSDLRAPVWRGAVELPFDDDRSDIEVADGAAYVVGETDGLSVLDVSEPASAHEVAALRDWAVVMDVVRVHDVAFVLDASTRPRGRRGSIVRSVDVGARDTLTDLGSIGVDITARDLGLGESALVLLGDSSVSRIDVGNPAVMRENGRYDAGRPLGWMSTAGTFVYVLSSDDSAALIELGLSPADGLVETRRRVLGETVTGLAASERLIAVGVEASGGACRTGVVILDTVSMDEAGFVPLEAQPQAIELEGGWLYTAYYDHVIGNSTVLAYEVTDPGTPVYGGGIELSGWVSGIEASGSYLYISCGRGREAQVCLFAARGSMSSWPIHHIVRLPGRTEGLAIGQKSLLFAQAHMGLYVFSSPEEWGRTAFLPLALGFR